jgi:plastocyanin
MRAMMMAVGLAATMVACGKGGEQQQAEKPMEQAPAAAPAATGAVHEVEMHFDGKVGHYTPAELTIKSGDVVKFVVKSGPPHNVAFWADSIPAGGADVLNRNMPETMASLTGPLKVGIDEAYEISFAGAPAGEYKFFCTPHLTFGMKGKITVQ